MPFSNQQWKNIGIAFTVFIIILGIAEIVKNGPDRRGSRGLGHGRIPGIVYTIAGSVALYYIIRHNPDDES